MWRFVLTFFALFPIAPLVAVLQLGCAVLASLFVLVVFATSFPS